MVPDCYGSKAGMYIIPIVISFGNRLKKATCDTASGIKWLSDSKLKDLDFADDLALLDVSLMEMQDRTSRVEDAAKLTGLQVNAGKTKMMIMGTLPYGEDKKLFEVDCCRW